MCLDGTDTAMRHLANVVLAGVGTGAYMSSQNRSFATGVGVAFLTYSMGTLTTETVESCFKYYRGMQLSQEQEDSCQSSYKTTILKISAICSIGLLPAAFTAKSAMDNSLPYKDIFLAQLLGTYLPLVGLTHVIEIIKWLSKKFIPIPDRQLPYIGQEIAESDFNGSSDL